MSLYIGLMSGTSMDGIDAALVDVSTQTLIHGLTVPYTQVLANILLHFNAQNPIKPHVLLEYHHLIGSAFATAVHTLLDATNHDAKDIQGIGSHGQTVLHFPENNIPTTLQLGCPHTIAAQTNIPVVADFRTRDLVLGGQGAPFAPYYHDILFKSYALPLTIVNIGGIANLTYLEKDQPPIGFDTGPGNGLLNDWIQQHRNLSYDNSGDWARSGQVIPELLDKLAADLYFQKNYPKSIDKRYFSTEWLCANLQSLNLAQSAKPEDIQATLTHLTALTIARGFAQIEKTRAPTQLVFVCGGGAHNHYLLEVMREYMPDKTIQTTQHVAIHPDYIEAMMFAWFAHQTLQRTPLDLRTITGSSKPYILGAIYL